MVQRAGPTASCLKGVPTPSGDQTAQVSASCPTSQSKKPKPRKPRGLDLIQSCARFYANGTAGVRHANQNLPTPCLRLAAQAPARHARTSTKLIVAACLFLGVLPSLALAGIVWWGSTTRPMAEFTAERHVETSSVVVPQVDAEADTEVLVPAKQNPDNLGGMIVHKVKIQPIPPVPEQPTDERWTLSDQFGSPD